MDDGIGVVAVIGGHVVCDRLIRLEHVEAASLATQSSGFIDVGAV